MCASPSEAGIAALHHVRGHPILPSTVSSNTFICFHLLGPRLPVALPPPLLRPWTTQERPGSLSEPRPHVLTTSTHRHIDQAPPTPALPPSKAGAPSPRNVLAASGSRPTRLPVRSPSQLAIAAVFRPLLTLSESPPASSVPNIDRPGTQHWTSTVVQPSNRLGVFVCTASLRLRVPRLSTALNTTSNACCTPTCRLRPARVRL
jgi:hypothetical protein